MSVSASPGAGDEAERLRRQRAALAWFGGHALRSDDLDALLQEACELVSKATGVELVKVLELMPGGDDLLVRAGINWAPGVVGKAKLSAHEGSPAGYALQTEAPVISRDVDLERRFEIPPVLAAHRVKSMINVVIKGSRNCWGVLEVDSRNVRDFDADDVAFLQNYANLLAAAIERLQLNAQLHMLAERRNIVLGELQHRVRNLLANIRALARRTLVSSGSLQEFAERFDTRLGALARTQELLSSQPEGNVSLGDLLREELEAHGAQPGTRYTLEGPAVSLSPGAAQALGMAIHELATNASKYGALKVNAGRIQVSWSVVAAASGMSIVIHWRESGVELTGPPTRRGMGSEMLEQGLPYMLGGSCSLNFNRDGLECSIEFDLPSHRER